MEHLNKQQIVLLTLFCSFVASIATGITVVSLLDQAPADVSQTINRVVERTVERVIPSDTFSNTTQTKSVTVPVDQDSLITGAISKSVKSFVRLYIAIGGQKTFIGTGIIITQEGVIATDKAIIGEDIALSGQYSAETTDGKSFAIRLASLDANAAGKEKGIAFVMPKEPVKDLTAAKLLSGPLKLGQSIISLGGRSKNTVEVGIVSSVNQDANQNVTSIDTTLRTESILNGSPIVTLDGSIAGMSVTVAELGKTIFIPSTFISQIKINN